MRQAPRQMARVLDTALRESRPVYIEIPRDMPQRVCDEVPDTPPTEVDAQALAACADELLQRLRQARRPMLMVGVEVRRYALEAKVAELARRLAVPVVTSFMGRGLLTGCDAPLRGTYLGLAADAGLTADVGLARVRFQLIDIRLAAGARSPTLTRFVQAVRRLSSPG